MRADTEGINMFQFLKRKASKRKETFDNLVKKIDSYPYLKDYERKSLYKEILTSDLNSNLKKILVDRYELKSKSFILAQKLVQKEKDEKVKKHQSKTEKETEAKVENEKVEGVRIAKVLKGLEKRFLLNNINNKDNVKHSEVRAFYSGDFVNADGEIKDFLFIYDKEKEVFYLPINKSVEYSLDIVLKDDDFLIVIIDSEL